MVEIEVSGKYACFTSLSRAERFSYPVLTPSAADGILASIYWKPQMKWQIRQIAVLKPIQYIQFKRKEIKSAGTYTDPNFNIEDQELHTLRMTVCLYDVAYRIKAWILSDDPAKHLDTFARRLKRGQCYKTPCLGFREFHAEVKPPGDALPLPVSMELGYLPYRPNGGDIQFFPAVMKDGIIEVPR